MTLRFLALVLASVLLVSAPAVADDRTRVAVLPVVVHSMDPPDYLRQGLVDMLVSRLGTSPQLAVVRVEDVAQATTELGTARASARSVGAEYVVFGSFTRFGEGASLDLQCAEVRDDAGAGRKIFIQSGTLGEIIPRLDELASKIAVHIASGGGPELPPVASGPEEGREDRTPGLDALERRVEALEQQVFTEPVEEDLRDPERSAFQDTP